jgi:predicted dehydrogenase
MSPVSKSKCTRRSFVGTAAATVAASTLPRWFVEELHGASQRNESSEENRALSVALIGCGGRGRGIARHASELGQVIALCDLDDRQLAEAQKTWPAAATAKDFRSVIDRKDVDIVICGTVDHWHALVSIAAMRAGKDVYCEKPLTLTIDEGKHVVAARQQTGRILQTGSQQRSDARFRLACELVRNGRIGKPQKIDVFLPSGRREGPFETTPVPDGFDWEMWQGPTPQVDYIKERTHVTFRYWWDYSGGTMTDWGAHHNDIALWALGLERSGPVSIAGQPRIEMIPGGFTAASEYDVEYTYAGGVTHRCRSTSANAWNGQVLDPQGQQHGVKFIGSEGWVWVTRGAIEASDPEMLVEPFGSDAVRLYASNDHMGNFFECVKSRKQPVCDAEIGHRSASLCHLGVIAMRAGRKLDWDPTSETFDDQEANKWLVREMRAPWSLKDVS